MAKRVRPACMGTGHVGAPTFYRQKYCVEIVEYFQNFKIITVDEKTGKETLQPPASLAKFATKIGVSWQSLHEWCKVHPEFKEAFAKAKKIYEDIIVDGAIIGKYNAFFSKCVMANWFAWVDKKEVESTNRNSDISEDELDKKIAELTQRLLGSKE